MEKFIEADDDYDSITKTSPFTIINFNIMTDCIIKCTHLNNYSTNIINYLTPCIYVLIIMPSISIKNN